MPPQLTYKDVVLLLTTPRACHVDGKTTIGAFLPSARWAASWQYPFCKLF
jgi:hypothetical protein